MSLDKEDTEVKNEYENTKENDLRFDNQDSDDIRSNVESLNKWRLMLGKYSDNNISFNESDTKVNYIDMDNLLDYLYAREYDEENGVRKDLGYRNGSKDNSNLTVPTWITEIRKLFPKKTVEVLEKHALEKYNMNELLTDKEVLEKLEPNRELLKNILQLKHLMKGEVLDTAKKIVAKIAEEITKELESEVKRNITGHVNKNKSSLIKSSRSIDFKKTINKNLKNYDLERKMLAVDKVYFNDRIKRYNPWQVIILVDESGSMIDSVIHSAVMAGIFAKLPMLKTNLVIFDTNVVDLSGYIYDPVRTLMSVQLGGGTDIGKALRYAETLIQNPYRTMVILISDLYEGVSYQKMYSAAKSIIESNAKLIALTSLDMDANPVYDKHAGNNLTGFGADVAAMTPGGLSKWIAEIIS